ncbi:filamentous hemagglutinin N-terminal domain-containing protein [Dendronalium sp. ChiSLP03b]|uniref:two-partner secretion domain-containing protein n=1 Tax=Dendronalium sp. ChiSLP03b TaxID=3075381 RepID=UPI002AD36E5B|nr:filamentous hemagglutinin N-terminal domain-containing protein [Dendronalium sp. ChiSLP03b]MDZ8207373.1 filamentous hemagglutinin N-terminal domain-containing protein [Dendronalium sp. ChiSLP03b]
MSTLGVWFKSLGFAVGGAIALSINSAVAQIDPDATLPNNSQVTTQYNIRIIEGGTQSGSNLFHSFKEFSLPTGSTAEFKNAADIQNIISRVTGKSISNIDGILKTHGTANLFLINPNGVIFGSNASLDIGGSFVASTASSLNFADGTKFSAIDPQTTPLLSVSVPIGLQFGATAAPIRNQSQARVSGISNPVGLQVKPNTTLALVGGDITLEGGNLTAASGRIELGSVAANSLVSLKPINQGWILGYENVHNFQNIQLIWRTVNGVNIPSQVDANNRDGNGGNIQVRGNTVELKGYPVRLRTQTTGAKDGGDLTINARKLIVRDGAAVSTATRGQGNGGKLIVNTSETVEVFGSFTDPDGVITPSSLFSSTAVAGKAGDITINTGKLRIQDGGQIATDSIANSQRIAGKGAGGNLTVNASESVELIGTSKNPNVTSGLFASTNTSGDAGKVTVNTGKLIIWDGAEITVNSQSSKSFSYPQGAANIGKAGDINVTARSIQLENKGKLTSNSELGQGGNITLQVRDLLLMRRNSQISTNSGKSGTGGNGGNIKIDAPNGLIFAVPLNNSDITANAFFGSGGQITINANSLFGFVQRDRADLVKLLNTEKPEELNPSRVPTNDITAFSQENPSLSGSVEINSPDVDPSQGLVELPADVVDASRQIVAGCNAGKTARASFTTTGRGGIESSPTDPLISDAVLADWISPEAQDKNRADGLQNRVMMQQQKPAQVISQKVKSMTAPTQIVEAQGWVVDSNGDVVLVAQAPAVIPHSPALNPASCALRSRE